MRSRPFLKVRFEKGNHNLMKEFLYEINELEVMCRGCFIIVKTQRSGSPPRVAFYVFNPALTYWSLFRLRTNLFCKDSIREGTIFIPGRVGSLLYFIAIDLIQNGGQGLDHMMKRGFFSLLF